MRILDLVSVDDNNFSVSVYAYLGIGWFEPRLEYAPEGDDGGRVLGAGGINVDPEFIKLECPYSILYVVHKNSLQASVCYFNCICFCCCSVCVKSILRQTTNFLCCRYLWFPNLIISAVKDFKPVSELRPQTLLKIKKDKE